MTKQELIESVESDINRALDELNAGEDADLEIAASILFQASQRLLDSEESDT